MHTENILIIDDNELLLYCMKHFFEKEFHEVVAVCTGEDAVIHLKQQLYNIVILDVNLPGMDGWGVLEYINRHSQESRVIIISSNEDKEIRQKALRKGALEFIEKPFDIHELKNIILRILSYSNRSPRAYKTFEVKLNNEHKGQTHDLSATGMFIMSDVSLNCGTVLDITLFTPDREGISLKGRVVRTDGNKDDGRRYGLGIQLTEQPSDYSFLIDSFLT